MSIVWQHPWLFGLTTYIVVIAGLIWGLAKRFDQLQSDVGGAASPADIRCQRDRHDWRLIDANGDKIKCYRCNKEAVLGVLTDA